MKKVTLLELISFNGVTSLRNHQLTALKGGGGDDIKHPFCHGDERPSDDDGGGGDEEGFIPPPGPG